MGEVRQEPSYLAIQYLHDTEQYPVSKLCAALHIPRCSYYKWRKREKNKFSYSTADALFSLLNYVPDFRDILIFEGLLFSTDVNL